MKKILYFANVRLPTEKAHGVQIMKMCEALSQAGWGLTLIVPRRIQINSELVGKNPLRYYQIKSAFTIKYIWNIDLLPLHQKGVNLGWLSYLIQEGSYAVAAWVYALMRPDEIIYTRSQLVAILCGISRKRVMFEAHDSCNSWLDKAVARTATSVVAITRSIEKSYQPLAKKVVYAPDGVGDEFFINLTYANARKHLAMPASETIILYTGNLYDWKGVNTLLEAARLLPGYHFYFIGGSVIDNNIKPLQYAYGDYENIHIMGHKPYEEIPVWLKAANVLVLPNSAKTKKGREDTSPLKLFEYLASGTPVVAANVPAITEIVDNTTISYFKPDNVKSLVDALQLVLSENNKNKSKKSIDVSRKYTWVKRAQHIMSTIE